MSISAFRQIELTNGADVEEDSSYLESLSETPLKSISKLVMTMEPITTPITMPKRRNMYTFVSILGLSAFMDPVIFLVPTPAGNYLENITLNTANVVCRCRG